LNRIAAGTTGGKIKMKTTTLKGLNFSVGFYLFNPFGVIKNFTAFIRRFYLRLFKSYPSGEKKISPTEWNTMSSSKNFFGQPKMTRKVAQQKNTEGTIKINERA
jgi:hypothetical protein